MSVGGCYTDFHIDFGGTSVWYHIMRGKKVSSISCLNIIPEEIVFIMQSEEYMYFAVKIRSLILSEPDVLSEMLLSNMMFLMIEEE